MRSALVFGSVDHQSIQALLPPHVAEEAQAIGAECEGEVHVHSDYHFGDKVWTLATTKWVAPHRDWVSGNYTVGIVLQSGGQHLFTGNGRRVAQLRPGDVFVLHNQSHHGASVDDRKADIPALVFLCHDFHAQAMPEAVNAAKAIIDELLRRACAKKELQQPRFGWTA